MPGVATWWCGEKSAEIFVAENLSNLVIKPVFASPGAQPIFGSRLSSSEKQALLARIHASPREFVAQEQVALSTAPVWEDGTLSPRHLVVRVYAVASGGSYSVMPGGLTRVTPTLDNLVTSMQSGGGSKDTWIIAEGPTSQFSLLPSGAPRLNISRATFDLPSRVADNLFWLGRYAERIEPVMRIARAILPRLFQESDLTAIAGVKTGARILAGLGYTSLELGESSIDLASLEHDILAVVFNEEERNNLPANIRHVRRLGGLLRDRISADAWRILNQIENLLPAAMPPEAFRISAAQAFLDEALNTLAAFSGLVMESMTRGDGWRFLDMGRRIERATQMVDLIRYGLGFEEEAESGQLEFLLEIADSSITYRSRYLTSMQPDLVLDLLLVDEANPRSVAYQLARVAEHVEHLPGSHSIRRAPESRIAISLLTAVQLAEVGELESRNSEGQRANLEALLNRLSIDLRSLSETLTREYFNQAGPSRRFSVA